MMRKKTVFSLYKKEMLDILRDKKTILMMIVIPLILYPLIFAGSMLLASSMMNASTSKSYSIGFEGVEDEEAMRSFFEHDGKEHEYSFVFVSPPESYEEALRNEALDAYVSGAVSENRPYFSIVYMASRTDSQTAAGMIRDVIRDYSDKTTRSLIEEAGLNADEVMEPMRFALQDMSSDEENAGFFMGMIIPFLLITSILMGAMYPAIDTTAGEKERGTLETLLTLPVRNMELITAKFLATSTVAVAAAFLNVISMSFMALYMSDSISIANGSNIDLLSFLPAALVTLLCILVFAMFASAVCLSSCIFARSFKEAQNYTTPVMLLFMVGGMAGMIPQVGLNSTTALIPVVNIALLIADIFSFNFRLELIAAVLLSNLAYTAIAVVLMTRLFSSENILFGEASANLRLLDRRRDMKKGQIPGIGDCVLLLSTVMIVLMFAGGPAVLHLKLYGLIIQQSMILILTAAYAWYIKADAVELFSLRRPKALHILSAVLCWLGAFIIVQIFADLLLKVFPGLNTESSELLVELWEGQPLWILIFTIALMPAICEECAFRGFLLSALSDKLKFIPAIVLTGVIFAAYHLNFLQLILITPLGILSSYFVLKHRSIFLSVVMHFLNNLTSVLMQQYSEEIVTALPVLGKEDPGVVFYIVSVLIGAAVLGTGILLQRDKPSKAEG
ncbi:MAG: CPBP family intramembrane metalloprotease [Lachnospiraceae bacterium]|nr:CPBP family intramembrane metalloprotease [Lachnospiraceae bacterium]